MSGPLLFDRVKETSTTTGTGTLTLAGAVSGFRAFSVVGDGNTCFYSIVHQSAAEWEVGIGTYTASGTTLARTKILASSNSGSAVNFSAGTKDVFISPPAAVLTPPFEVQGRLTTESGVPVSTSDRTAQSTIYFTPYKGNRITIFNGNVWLRYAFSEISLALSGLTSGKNYDVFIYDNAGTLTLELSAAWTNDTTRADALALQDGVYVKSGATTRLWLGTIRTTGTTTTEDSNGGAHQAGGKRFVWNAYNQVERQSSVIDTTDSWNYTTQTIRQANGASGNKVEIVLGHAAALVTATVVGGLYQVGSNNSATIGIGIDSTTSFSGIRGYMRQEAGGAFEGTIVGNYSGQPGLGYHYVSWNEKGATNAYFGGDVAGAGLQSGLVVRHAA